MKTTEAQALINVLNRAGLVNAMEDQAVVWADALDDIQFEDATEAVLELNRTRTSDERRVTPGDIRVAVREVRRRRADRYAGWRAHITPPDTDDYQLQLGWARRVERYLGDGLDPEAADNRARADLDLEPRPQIEPDRPVTALVQNVANAMPRIPRPAA